jgi:predicted Rossmann-fold nucleotide-binding protein
LLEWIKTVLLEKENNVSPEDLDLISVVDTAEEAVKVIDDFYETFVLSPNF